MNQSEFSPPSRLSASLLAQKGAARPAMRRPNTASPRFAVHAADARPEIVPNTNGQAEMMAVEVTEGEVTSGGITAAEAASGEAASGKVTAGEVAEGKVTVGGITAPKSSAENGATDEAAAPQIEAHEAAARRIEVQDRTAQMRAAEQLAAIDLEDLGWNDMGDEPPISADPRQPANAPQVVACEEDGPAAHTDSANPEVLGGQSFTRAAQNSTSVIADALNLAQREGRVAQLRPLSMHVSSPQPLSQMARQSENNFTVDAPGQSVVEASDISQAQTPENSAEKLPEKSPKKSTGKSGKKAAFTLRLDEARHLKLRLACTLKKCSAQTLVTIAVDDLLSKICDLDGLTEDLLRKDSGSKEPQSNKMQPTKLQSPTVSALTPSAEPEVRKQGK